MKEIIPLPKKIFATFLNIDGFTLIEMLYSFAVFTMVIFFITPIMNLMFQQSDLQQELQAMEWDVFTSQIKKEIRMSSKLEVANNCLILTEDIGTIVYEKYENILRRRVNNTGHEVLLQNVSQVNFTLLSGIVRISVKDRNQKEYTVDIFTFVNWIGVL